MILMISYKNINIDIIIIDIMLIMITSEYIVVPLQIWTPKDFTIANLEHPVPKSWLRPWRRVLNRI